MIIKPSLLKSIALVSAFPLLYSCSKSKPNTIDQIKSLGKATISGTVTARVVDTAGAAAVQHFPAGTTITAWINSKQLLLVSYDSVNYLPKQYSTTVDAAGKYSLTVDVSSYQPATVMIDSMEYTIIRNAIGVIHHDSVYTVKYMFHPSVFGITVKNNDAITRDITFF
jgi:hypothetical protein